MEYRLIEYVKKNPVLYEKQYRTVKYLDEKNSKWQEIGRILRRDPSEVRLKWKHLRDTYLRSYKQKIKKGDDGDVLSTKTWQYYNAMSFLNNQFEDNVIFKSEETFDEETEAAITSLNQSDSDAHFDVTIYNEAELSNEADFEIENFDLNDYVKKIDNPNTNNAPNTSNTNPSNSTNATASTSNNNNGPSYRQDDLKGKKKYDKEALIHDACQEMTSLLKNAKKHFTPPSSNQVFFNSLALQVEEANLPALTQMRLQQRILEMVTLEIINHQQQPHNIQQL